MRRTLSYANVMATLAFFFALTGASIAGVKYLAATDPIPSTSDLTGMYGNPLIANGKVATSKIADGAVTTGKIADGAVTSSKFDGAAVAPDSTRLGGHLAGAFPLVVARGAFNVNTFVPLDQCADYAITVTGVDPNTDTVVVTRPAEAGSGLVALGYLDSNLVVLEACNFSYPSSSGLWTGNTWHYLVLR